MLYKLVYIIYHWLRIVWHNTPVFICQWNKTLLKQAAICKGKLCINQTSKYQGLYIVLQNTGVLYFSRSFVRKFCSPGIRLWTFPPKTLLTSTICLLQVCMMFHENSASWQNFVQTLWKIVLLKNQCSLHCVLTNADISLHSSFTFSYSEMKITLLFTFFSDKKTKIVHVHLLYKSDKAELINYIKIGSLLLLIWEDEQDFFFDKNLSF